MSRRIAFMLTVGVAALAALGTSTAIAAEHETGPDPATVPSVQTVTASGLYKLGDEIEITVTFDESVTVTGNPTLALAAGVTGRVATAAEGEGESVSFTYTVGEGDSADPLDYSSTDALTGTITSTADTDVDADLTLPTPGDAGSLAVSGVAIDGIVPTATITVAPTSIGPSDTGLVTITFSEPVVGFDNDDLDVPNGTLSAVEPDTDGLVYTADFTPDADVLAPTNVITLIGAGVTDAAGNVMANTTSNNYAIDTEPPTAEIQVTPNVVGSGSPAQVTFTFSSPVSGFTNADLTVPNGTLSDVAVGTNASVWTASFTPTVGLTEPDNVITLDLTGVTDALDTPGVGTAASNTFDIDTVAPTATVEVAPEVVGTGQTATVTVTFSKPVRGLTSANLTSANGTIDQVSPQQTGATDRRARSDDLATTWTAVFTPTPGLVEASTVVILNFSGVTDAAGNTGTDNASSATFTVDTPATDSPTTTTTTTVPTTTTTTTVPAVVDPTTTTTTTTAAPVAPVVTSPAAGGGGALPASGSSVPFRFALLAAFVFPIGLALLATDERRRSRQRGSSIR